jgi:hypothetical protein
MMIIFIETASVGVMVSVLASYVWVDREFQSQSGQSKDYEIGICYFSGINTLFRSKNKD